MTPESMVDPSMPVSARQLPKFEPDTLDTHTAAWTRAFFSAPNRVVTVFWAGGAVAIVSVLPLGRWPHRSFLALAVIAGVCGVACGLRLVTGWRPPRWALHVDVGVATVLASLLAAIGVNNGVPFFELYVWIVLFTALYFRPLAVLAHTASVGAAYALVLAFGPRVADPWAAWLAIFGTASVAAAVVLGLTSVLRSTARTDPLTGLANRRMWDERVEEEVERSARTGTALSVVMLDLDGFKAVNDAGGHAAGDRLLVDLAQTWRGVLRGGGDFLARVGGDEFCLLAPGSDEIGARVLARRLADALPGGVSASVGVATWDRAEGASDLLHRADQAMYHAKGRRRRGGGPSSA